MEITVQYYGMLAEITGRANELLTVKDNLSVGELRESILSKYPGVINKKYKVAVNLQLSGDEVFVNPDSEVALLPPFAGG